MSSQEMGILASANWGLLPGYTVIGIALGGVYALAAIGLVLYSQHRSLEEPAEQPTAQMLEPLPVDGVADRLLALVLPVPAFRS